MADKAATSIDRGVKAGGSPAGRGPELELYGHVTLVQGYSLSSYVGCHALIALKDTPGKTVAVLTSEAQLQSLLEGALVTGNVVGVLGHKLKDPSAPLGGTWTVDVYGVDSVILSNAS